MISVPTTLILGAGASIASGYPTGAELIDKIIGLLNLYVPDQNNEPIQLLELCDKTKHPRCLSEHVMLYELCAKIKRGRIRNIDSFLRDNPELETLGRKVITYLIRSYEYKHHQHGDIFPEFRDSKPWYPILFDSLISQTPDASKIAESHALKIITFNYDVSLDYFLAQALLDNSRTKPYAKEIFNSIPIIHIYGKIGDIQINDLKINYNYGEYASKIKLNGNHLLEPASWIKSEDSQIHVVGEGKNGKDDVRRDAQLAMSYIEKSKRIIAMGFDFLPENCDLIKIPEAVWLSKEFNYINYDGAPALVERVRKYIGQSFGKQHLGDCFEVITKRFELAN